MTIKFMINDHKIYDDMTTKFMKRDMFYYLHGHLKIVRYNHKVKKRWSYDWVFRKQKSSAGKFTCTSDELEAEQDSSEAVQGLHFRN